MQRQALSRKCINMLHFLKSLSSSCIHCAISLLQQYNQSGGEDAEAGHHDARGLHGRGQRYEDAAARQTSASLRCRHQDTTHLYHH